MQVQGNYAPPPQHHPYHIPYHTPLPGPQDHELKKQYLTLLPPQQIIDICLNFDLHVPLYVKSTVWPLDINAAIAALQKATPPIPEPPIAETSQTNGLPAMGSLDGTADSSSSTEQSGKPDEHQPPDASSSTPGPSSVPPEQQEQSSTQTLQPQPPPQQPPYPHQPYGYGHPQAAYPHAPYYQHPPPGYPYPHGSYPPYQMPGYPQPQHATPFAQPQPNPPFTNTPLPPPAQQPQQPVDNFDQPQHMSTDDLPSYEEMIVEALQESKEPEGCAPKDLFNWMSRTYPLQQNFRPSASQALQKAFKRGRFQKSSNGKYRINATWEGGNTSRRTTRRPQTQTSGSAPPTASPFTHAPLVHHQQQSQTPANAPNPSFQTPYAFPYGYPGFPPPEQPPAAPAAAPSTEEGDAADAYEAAQNILKAINFGGLLEFPAEEDEAPAVPQPPAEELASTPMPAIGSDPVAGNTTEVDSAGLVTTPSGNPRAELQAQLALLAAQLAELAHTDDEDAGSAQPPQLSSEAPLIINHPQPIIPSTAANPPPLIAEAPPPPPPPLPPPMDYLLMDHLQMEEEEEDSDDDDMEEVI